MRSAEGPVRGRARTREYQAYLGPLLVWGSRPVWRTEGGGVKQRGEQRHVTDKLKVQRRRRARRNRARRNRARRNRGRRNRGRADHAWRL